MRCHPAWKIGVADNGNARLGDDLLARNRQRAVAPLFSGQIHDHRPRLHRVDHILGPQNRRGAVRDKRGGDDNIHIRGQLAEPGQLRGAKLGRGRRRVTARAASLGCLIVGGEIREHERGPHRFDLFGHFGAHVEGVGHRAQGARGTNRGQPRHTGPNHQHLGRGDLARGGHLAGEKPPERVGGFENRTITGDIGHRAERIHLLRARNARDHVHGDDMRAAAAGQLQQRWIVTGIEERYQRLPRAQPLDFPLKRSAHLGNHIDCLEQGGAGLDDLDPCLGIFRIGKTSRCTGPGFDGDIVTQLLQKARRCGGDRHPRLVRVGFLWCSDLHLHSLSLHRGCAGCATTPAPLARGWQGPGHPRNGPTGPGHPRLAR